MRLHNFTKVLFTYQNLALGAICVKKFHKTSLQFIEHGYGSLFVTRKLKYIHFNIFQIFEQKTNPMQNKGQLSIYECESECFSPIYHFERRTIIITRSSRQFHYIFKHAVLTPSPAYLLIRSKSCCFFCPAYDDSNS